MKFFIIEILLILLHISCNQNSQQYKPVIVTNIDKNTGEKSVFTKINNINEGEAYRYYNTGEIRVKAFYKNGELDSVFKQYYKNGNIEICGQYSKGVIDGKLYHYDTLGFIDGEDFYINDTIKIYGEVRYNLNHQLKEKAFYDYRDNKLPRYIGKLSFDGQNEIIPDKSNYYKVLNDTSVINTICSDTLMVEFYHSMPNSKLDVIIGKFITRESVDMNFIDNIVTDTNGNMRKYNYEWITIDSTNTLKYNLEDKNLGWNMLEGYILEVGEQNDLISYITTPIYIKYYKI